MDTTLHWITSFSQQPNSGTIKNKIGFFLTSGLILGNILELLITVSWEQDLSHKFPSDKKGNDDDSGNKMVMINEQTQYFPNIVI